MDFGSFDKLADYLLEHYPKECKASESGPVAAVKVIEMLQKRIVELEDELEHIRNASWDDKPYLDMNELD